MLRVIIVTVSGCLLFGCQASENNKTVDKDKGLSPTSFSKTVRFPVESVLAVNPILDTSCTIAQKIAPIYLGDEFISFRYQECDSKSVTTTVDQGTVEIIMVLKSPYSEPFLYEYPPLTIKTGNIKTPEEYLDDLYTTDGERRYCKRFEKSTGIWEIKNVEYSRIPGLPTDFFADFEPPIGHSKSEKEKLMLEMVSKYYAERDKKFDHQMKINRICEKLPLATYLFFEGEYVLTMPRSYAPILDMTSIKYHKK